VWRAGSGRHPAGATPGPAAAALRTPLAVILDGFAGLQDEAGHLVGQIRRQGDAFARAPAVVAAGVKDPHVHVRAVVFLRVPDLDRFAPVVLGHVGATAPHLPEGPARPRRRRRARARHADRPLRPGSRVGLTVAWRAVGFMAQNGLFFNPAGPAPAARWPAAAPNKRWCPRRPGT